MQHSKSDVRLAAKPRNDHFDPWNSSSTGHQRAENRLSGSTGWRDSRSMKLAHQFRSGGSGGDRIHDQVGAGSLDWDEKARALIPKDVRQRAQVSILDMLRSQKNVSKKNVKNFPTNDQDAAPDGKDFIEEERHISLKRGFFSGLVFYVNGNTSPLVSDHKLKQLLTENGGRVSIYLGRGEVTHVILGRSSEGTGPGQGGALAATKLQKEIQKVRGSAVKYIGVEWVLESLKVGKRLPETQFRFKFALKGQQSVGSFMKRGDGLSSAK